jgi:hypothetical protein
MIFSVSYKKSNNAHIVYLLMELSNGDDNGLGHGYISCELLEASNSSVWPFGIWAPSWAILLFRLIFYSPNIASLCNVW